MLMMMSDECPPAATSRDLQHLHQQTSVRVLNTQQQQNTGTQQSTSQHEEERSERRKHCALAVVRRSLKFLPRRRRLPGGTGLPKFNQLEMVITFTYRSSLVTIDACNFELSW